jgi:thioredoxin reductase (NADPH)
VPDEADVAIVGGGVAALTAATFAARLGLRATVLCDILVGGQVINVDAVANYPGFPEPIAGGDLAAIIEQQARDAGAEFVFGEVSSLARHGGGYTVASTGGQVAAGAVIVATGSRLRRLGVPGEDRLEGAGVSYCGSCDGPLFTGRRVLVIGGGDSAADEALVVAEHASEVVVATREGGLSAAASTAARVLAHERIVLRPHAEPIEIVGEDRVTGVRLRDVRDGELASLKVDGVFVFVGLEPNTGLLSGLVELDQHTGHVATDPWMATAVPGLFAAGDLRRDSPRQLVNAASDGATAAIAAHRFLAARSSS